MNSQLIFFFSFRYSQTQGRESIAAKLVANIITEAGANRVLACDIHSGQSIGYFDIPVDHVYCEVIVLTVFIYDIKSIFCPLIIMLCVSSM